MIESESTPGKQYAVNLAMGGWSCTCPSFEHRGVCKHIKHIMGVIRPKAISKEDLLKRLNK